MKPRARGVGLGIAACALLATIAAQAQAVHAQTMDWTCPWRAPLDAQQARESSDEYAWRLFVAVNWPADPRTRTARPSAAFGTGPVVWETWQNAADVYLDDGRDPGRWTRGVAITPIATEARFETFSLKDLQNVRHIVDGRMVPLTDPISGARRLTEIRMNRTAYDYIRGRELYDLDGQLRAIQDATGVHFPLGSTEIKAKWRPLRANDESRYHTVRVRLASGEVRLYGLTALHIVSKDAPHWFWATFEHVENPSLADSDGWQLPSSDRFACGDASPDCNRAPTGIGLEGTVWQNYRLRGTLSEFTDSHDRPLLLANSELESGLQRSSSCITCHARAALGVNHGAPMRLPIFDTKSAGNAANAPGDLTGTRGYVGTPRPEWYQAPGESASSLQQLDFVWSLAKAHPRKRS